MSQYTGVSPENRRRRSVVATKLHYHHNPFTFTTSFAFLPVNRSSPERNKRCRRTCSSPVIREVLRRKTSTPFFISCHVSVSF
ncbi:hypothetical protein HanIR_Chr08g0384541 [Helianthus annuus]|nr:hypothetical protein HanIR_Chr08g0384541 [Helianthus annuus]